MKLTELYEGNASALRVLGANGARARLRRRGMSAGMRHLQGRDGDGRARAPRRAGPCHLFTASHPRVSEPSSSCTYSLLRRQF